jgi:GDP-L-fucose synthase
MHLGKCLENKNWDAIRKDLNKYPIEGVNEKSGEDEILQILSKYGKVSSQATSNQLLFLKFEILIST